MPYSLVRFKFQTGVHIGSPKGGSSLDESRYTIHADTLFSAMCCALAKPSLIENLAAAFQRGELCISDALPYLNDCYYLPRPLYFDNQKQQASLSKAVKKAMFLPLPEKFGEPIVFKESVVFGKEEAVTRAHIGNLGATPYFVAVWHFLQNAGLYTIVWHENHQSFKLFENALSMLSLVGIGGKTSSGLGKFEFEKYPVPDVLEAMLRDKQAMYQMMLGTGLPNDDELDNVLQDGWYQLVRRGGFIQSAHYAPVQSKKRTLYMLSPGSCLRCRFKGGIRDVGISGAHPVWRLTNTLFVGVNPS